MLRPPLQEEGGADQGAGDAQERAGHAQGRKGHRRGSLQAVQDPRGSQVHRQGVRRHAPEAEGEPQEAVQGRRLIEERH